jgi:hypothetical protein
MRFCKYLVLTLLFLSSIPAHAADVTDMELHMFLAGLDTPAPPRRFEDTLILTYAPTNGGDPAASIRYVAASFAHENYRSIHVYNYNEQGVYFLVYPLPEGVETLRYRLVVDGLWQPDPFNPRTGRDRQGIPISEISVPERPQPVVESPVVDGPNAVRFYLEAPEGSRVTVAGTFNNWDPFMHAMREIRPGVYSARIRMRPGRHSYIYFFNGRRMLDPLNFRRSTDIEGNEVSTFFLGVQPP